MKFNQMGLKKLRNGHLIRISLDLFSIYPPSEIFNFANNALGKVMKLYIHLAKLTILFLNG